jgi:phage terminase large subunit-like protein
VRVLAASGIRSVVLCNTMSHAGRADQPEKQRVLHRRGLDQLEGEMMAFSREWDRAVDGSPNRLDAMVWGLTRLSKVITQIPIA